MIPISCPPGSYNNLTGQTTCLSCPAGYYCGEATIVPEDCPHGHWCPVGTMYGTEYACPNGTFSNKTKLSEPSECTECTAGFYCETDGLFGPTGPCEAGFYCARGSATPTPGDGAEYFYTGEACSEQSEAEINGVCPVGHYCPLGSRAPTQCPPGTMSSARGLKNVTQCQPCRPGFTCPESATINATIPCNSGFW